MLRAAKPLRERLREALRRELPGTQVSFEAADIVTQVMSFGSPTPIEVAVQGVSLQDDYAYAQKVQAQLAKLSFLRDLQFAQEKNLPDAGYQHRPRARRPVRPDHGGCGAVGGAGDFVFALYRSELLARSEFRQRLPDSGGAAPKPDAERRTSRRIFR